MDVLNTIFKPATQIDLERTVCPICLERTFSILFTANSMDRLTNISFNIERCNKCGLLITNPRPTQESIGIFYESGFYEEEEKSIKKLIVNPLMTVFHHLRLRQVTKAKKSGRILDVGCGKGIFLDVSAGKGWESWGIEPSKRSLAYVQKSSGAKIIEGRFEAVDLPDKYFDVITMWHTLEHFYDPMQTLRNIHKKLKDDGRLIIRVPNSSSWNFRIGKKRWFHLDVPRHLYHFSPSTLKILLYNAGFKVESLTTSSLEDNFIGTLQTMMALVGFRSGAIFNILKGSDTEESKSYLRIARGIITAIFALILSIPAFGLTEFSQLVGRGETLTIIAKKGIGTIISHYEIK